MKKNILHFIFLGLLVVCSYPAHTQIITTFVGDSVSGNSGDGGLATAAHISLPRGMAIDGAGNVYFADFYNQCIRKVSTSGIITKVAGNGTAGFSGDGGPATDAQFNGLEGLAADSSGNLYVAEFFNQCVRKVSVTGIITTFAGIGTAGGYSGDGGPATAAKVAVPSDVAVDKFGNVYIADYGNNVIRKISGGTITTFAGTGAPGYAGDGGPATAAQLNQPNAVAVDNIGNVYIADGVVYLRKVDISGIISTIAGNSIFGYYGDGGPATAAGFNDITGISLDPMGNIFITDGGSNAVREINVLGMVGTIAGTGIPGYNGDGIPAQFAQLNSPWGVAVDGSGNIYVSDQDNSRIRKITAPTAVPEINKTQAAIILYPNPAQNELTVTTIATLTTISITTPLGQTVYSANCNTETWHINLSAFPPGIYFIKINGTEIRKFVKQ